jgi:hypothetical protein
VGFILESRNCSIGGVPQDFSHVNSSEAKLHSPAMNAALFSTQKGSVLVMEFGEQLILLPMTGQEKPVVLGRVTPLERVQN